MIFYQGGFPYSLKIADFPIPYSLKKIQEIETRQCLEGVQRRNGKVIMHYPDLGYRERRERLCHLNLLSLPLRR